MAQDSAGPRDVEGSTAAPGVRQPGITRAVSPRVATAGATGPDSAGLERDLTKQHWIKLSLLVLV